MLRERYEKKAGLKPCGIHTAIGHINELWRWKDIPYLKDNEGMLPPFIIAVGSRVRVKKAPDVLRLKEPVFIDEVAREEAGLDAYGRVALLVGIFEGRKIAFPLAVVETQMGCPATQINLKEVLYYAKDCGYCLGGTTIKSDGIYVIRAGTAAGVNSFFSSELRLSIGDLAIANENYGSVGAIIQSRISILNFAGVQVSEKADALRKSLAEQGLFTSHDFMSLKTVCSSRLVFHIQAAANELKLRNIVGANFTKDSLYAEMNEESFAWLRDNYSIVSTEMEQMVIDILAAEFRKQGIPVYSGLISALIGAIPGKSFPENEDEKRAACEAEENALRVAARAFERIAESINAIC